MTDNVNPNLLGLLAESEYPGDWAPPQSDSKLGDCALVTGNRSMVPAMKAAKSFRALSILPVAMFLVGCYWGFLPGMGPPQPSATKTVLCKDRLNRSAFFTKSCPDGFTFIREGP